MVRSSFSSMSCIPLWVLAQGLIRPWMHQYPQTSSCSWYPPYGRSDDSDRVPKAYREGCLVRRFAKVTIEEPTVEDSIAILTGLKGTFEKYHRVRIGQAVERLL